MLVLSSWIPGGFIYLWALFRSCPSTASFLLFLFVLKALPQLRSTEVQGMENGRVLLAGVKQWHVYGWSKCIWNVCLQCSGAVWYLLPFLVLWSQREVLISSASKWGRCHRRWTSITSHLPDCSASSSGPARGGSRKKTKLRAFLVTPKTWHWLLWYWWILCSRS